MGFYLWGNVKIPKRARLSLSFLRELPEGFRGRIWDEECRGLLVEIDERNEWPGMWLGRFKEKSGKTKTYPLGGCGFRGGGWSARAAREMYRKYEHFIVGWNSEAPEGMCHACYWHFDKVRSNRPAHYKSGRCRECEFRFRAMKLEFLLEKSQLDALYGLRNAVKRARN